MLLNLTNHPSSNWPENQKSLAKERYQKIQELPFPKINPEWNEEELDQLVEEYENKIQKLKPQAVHIMGEMTFTYRLVNRLKEMGIPCIASTTERTDTFDEDDHKISTFKFVRFRNY